MKTIAAVLCGLAVAGATACAPADAADEQTADWTISSTPILSIGQADGADEYLFQSVSRAALLTDGSIAVGDGGLKALRVYDSNGQFVREMGNAGEGPGEFENIRDLWIEGDMINVFDPRIMRLTRYRADGSLESSRNLLPPPTSDLAPGSNLDAFLGVFADGSVGLGWLAWGGSLEAGQITEDKFLLGRFGADGTFLGMMGEETFFQRTGFEGGGGSPVAYTPVPYTAVYGDSLYFTDGSAPRIEVRDFEGNVGRTISVPALAADVDAALAALEDRLEEDHPFYSIRNLRGSPRPESIPAIGGLLIDTEGFVWVRSYEAPDDALWLSGSIQRSGGLWWVVARTGDVVATVRMPAGVRPVQISADRVVGVSRDELDVEHVVVHALER